MTMRLANLPKLFPFQSSVETVRAHHWRHFTDPYIGCSFNCQYCLYKGPGNYGEHVRPVDQVQLAVDPSEIGILDLGATTDPYQHLEEKEQRTRRLLLEIEEHKVPVFVLTRGTLVLRDMDILARLATAGLVEVCFSVISLRELVSRALEPGAPEPRARIDAARVLANAGIPVSFHVAPLIPGLDSAGGRLELANELGRAGASHIFLAMLGARSPFWATFLDSLHSDPAIVNDWTTFELAYSGIEFERAAATTCDIGTSRDTMGPFLDTALHFGIPVVSENYPCFSVGTLEDGIYRWKLPTVHDMTEWIRRQSGPVCWEQFYNDYYAAFRPPASLIPLVRRCWQDGELFEGSRIGAAGERGGFFAASDRIFAPPHRTLVARKSAAR